ncbi:MAG: DNA/RNA non-specific endonuclease [Ardenticatenaceae bacterium]|nr:DNA/RNA non-specific endonuclease [Ardenticatenaceae bacterium]
MTQKQVDGKKLHWKGEEGVTTVEWISLFAVVFVLAVIVLAYFNRAVVPGGVVNVEVSGQLNRQINAFDAGGSGGPGSLIGSPPGTGSVEEERGILGSIFNGVTEFAGGVLSQGWDAVVGVVTFGRDLVALAPITGDIYGFFDPDGRAQIQNQYEALWNAIVSDPFGTGKMLLEAMVEPIVQDWQDGRYLHAAGRSVFEVIMLFVPGDEAGKLRFLSRLDNATPDELLRIISQADRLTPDEVGHLMNRLDNLTPDEASQLIEAINRLPPDEARRLERLLGCSFTADTLVHTATGPVAISQLSLGTPVWAIDEHSGRFGYYPVIAIWSHEDDNLLDLTISGETINTTSDHPFLTADGQWVTAGDLTIGQSVQGSFAAGVVEEAVALDASQTMFNITVSQANTYAVGDGGWVVHNTCTIEELRRAQRAVDGTPTVASREGPNGTPVDVSPEELRHPLPNSRYSVNGYYYETDQYGRVIEASGELRLDTAARNTRQQVEVGHEGVPRPNGNEYGVTDDGGHLIGSRFGGAGEAINMLPQNSALNRNGRWKQLENFWAERINAGETVHVEISPIYNGRGNRPTSYDVVYRVNNGDPITVNIPNNRTGTGGSGGVPGN